MVVVARVVRAEAPINGIINPRASRAQPRPRCGFSAAGFRLSFEFIMNNLLFGVIIGVLLAVIAYSVLTEPCPRAQDIIAAWEQIADDYQAGKISLDECSRRAGRLIECGEKWRRRHEQDPLRPSRDGN